MSSTLWKEKHRALVNLDSETVSIVLRLMSKKAVLESGVWPKTVEINPVFQKVKHVYYPHHRAVVDPPKR